MTARHIYVHVPFCTRRCTYCDFSIAVRRVVPVAEYLEALGREITRTALAPDPRTIYLGGGTPSRLGGEGVAQLLRLLGGVGDAEEVTVEVNPDDVTPEAARAWARAGVNRLSIGAQSFDPAVLAWMHRTHEAGAIGEAVRQARAAGIATVSLDVIFALPGIPARDLAADLASAIALDPDHISLYGLTVEPGTPLARRVARGEEQTAGEGRYEEEYLAIHERLGIAGYRFYEVSNAARPGREARHNAVYWSLRPYVGLGPSAHSYDGHQRWWNEPAYAQWVRLLAQGKSVVAGHEWLDERQRALEQLYLGLRTVEGVAVTDGTGLALKADDWVRAGWAHWRETPTGRLLALTPLGWLRLDELVAVV